MVGLEDCESLFSHLRTRRMITVKYLVRRFLGVQQLLDNQELGYIENLLLDNQELDNLLAAGH